MLLGPLSIVIAMFALWWLARQFLDERLSVVAIFLTSTQLYFNLLVPEFNHNVIQIPLWALSIALFWAATRKGDSFLFAFLGFALGLCLLAKYSAVLLYAFIVGWLIVDRKSREHLTFFKVVICIFTALAVASPNLFWLVQHDFQSLNYIQERMGDKLSIIDRFKTMVEFLLAQLGVTSPLLIFAWLAQKNFVSDSKPKLSSSAGYLLAAALVPLLISTAVPLIGGHPLRDMWAMMMFTSLGIGLVCLWPLAFERFFTGRWLLLWMVFQGLAVSIYAANIVIKTHVTESLSRANYPGPEIARLVEQNWLEKTQNAPLRYVIGSTWVAGNVAFFSKFTPTVMINGDKRISPWVDSDRLKACGYVLIWAPDKAGREMGRWMNDMNPGYATSQADVHLEANQKLFIPVTWVVVPPLKGSESEHSLTSGAPTITFRDVCALPKGA